MAVWYPTIWTCCTCGDSWSDGERMPRPFAPRWREQARREARIAWRRGLNRRQVSAWLTEHLRAS